jgi:signal transduction histidine kinase
VITVSASQSFTAGRLVVALAYAVGSGVVLYALMRGGRRLTRRLSGQSARVQWGMGVVMVVVAGLMLADYDVRFQTAIADDLPAGLVAVRTASIVAASVAGDVGALRDALVTVGEGERDIVVAHEARDEIGELARSAAAMAARLGAEERGRDAADAARRRLVAAVSHDLRTPIASLRLLVDAIDDDIVDEPTRRRYLQTMQTHIGSLSAMIDDLFELSRIEAGDITWSMRQVQLSELVDETVAAMTPEARSRQVDVRSVLTGPVVAARADAEKIQRVLFNLIRNAIRHTPADGSVTVRAEANDGGVEVEVADTGAGIAPEDREQVFELFYRGGAEASRSGDGAGLGLAIARAIVETHGGRIWLPASERGTRVRFSLPG